MGCPSTLLRISFPWQPSMSDPVKSCLEWKYTVLHWPFLFIFSQTLQKSCIQIEAWLPSLKAAFVIYDSMVKLLYDTMINTILLIVLFYVFSIKTLDTEVRLTDPHMFLGVTFFQKTPFSTCGPSGEVKGYILLPSIYEFCLGDLLVFLMSIFLLKCLLLKLQLRELQSW